MPKKNKYLPTESELEILHILWQPEPATVRFVHEELLKVRSIGYTTTLKQFQRMTEKGILSKIADGKAHKYTTLVSSDSIQESLFNKLLHSAFKGSKSQLLIHALGKGETSEEELKQLEVFIQSQKKKKQ